MTWHSRGDRRGRDPDAGGAPLEIEFEDEDPPPPGAPGRRLTRARAARVAATATAAATVLCCALLATHRPAATPPPPAAAYNGFAVTLRYLGARLASAGGRSIEVDLAVSPTQSSATTVSGFQVSQPGVSTSPGPGARPIAVPAPGTRVRLLLTVTDCPHVPKDETMAYVDVIAGVTGLGETERFTILGERYSADISRLLHEVCARG